MKLTSHRFSLQLLIWITAVQAIYGNSVQAQPHPFEGGKNQKQPQTAFPSPSETELPFRISNGYLILVEGAIGTRTHLKFLLDTGASISIVDSKIADSLKLYRKPKESFNFDRKLTWEQAAIPELRLGPITAINVAMLVGPLGEYSEFARDVDAIIGLDLLHLRDFTLDYGAKKVVFHPSATGLAQVRNDALTNGLTLEIQVQGHPVRLIVDTGFPGILLFQERLFARMPDLRMKGEVHNVNLGYRLHVKSMTLRDVAIGPSSSEVSVFLAQAPPPEILPGIDGVAGVAALNARRVHFNFTQRTLSWE